MRALPETLLESELFGHVKGAFTGAIADKPGRFLAADGGTIFLDEINSASPAMQVKLLRVLQERQFEPVGSSETRTVDVRVILATNVDLAQLVAEGKFRQDLYYRINVVTIKMPSLKDRGGGDVLLLANHFLRSFANDPTKEILGFQTRRKPPAQRTTARRTSASENAIERAGGRCRRPADELKISRTARNAGIGSAWSIGSNGNSQRQRQLPSPVPDHAMTLESAWKIRTPDHRTSPQTQQLESPIDRQGARHQPRRSTRKCQYRLDVWETNLVRLGEVRTSKHFNRESKRRETQPSLASRRGQPHPFPRLDPEIPRTTIAGTIAMHANAAKINTFHLDRKSITISCEKLERFGSIGCNNLLASSNQSDNHAWFCARARAAGYGRSQSAPGFEARSKG